MSEQLGQVEAFWDEHLCGSHFIDKEYLSEEFFAAYRAYRYKKEHHLLTDIPWESVQDKDMLEIGLGVGADATRWAQHAGSYTGIDLTNEAVTATRKHFDILNLEGDIQQGNAQELQFNNEQFGFVFSHGVLHHTPDMPKAFSEVSRVLKKDGEFLVMLYAKESFNYWVRIQWYFRWRLIMEVFLRKMGRKAKGNWVLHLQNIDKHGWAYMGWNRFPHHCTDGPECEVAYILSSSQTRKMLQAAGFKVLESRKAHFPITKGRLPKLERAVARMFGFYRFVRCKKA